jgi:quercetin dioxygenase-like cupin family protein
MELFRLGGAEKRTLGAEERVTYQGEQLRIVLTRLPPFHLQKIHRHELLFDATYVITGDVAVIEERESGRERVILCSGDFVILDPGPFHTLENASGEEALLLTIKSVRRPDLTREDFLRICEEDWYPRSDTSA